MNRIWSETILLNYRVQNLCHIIGYEIQGRRRFLFLLLIYIYNYELDNETKCISIAFYIGKLYISIHIEQGK